MREKKTMTTVEDGFEDCRVALKAFGLLAEAILTFSGEELREARIADQLVEIGKAVKEAGITDEQLASVVSEIRKKLGMPSTADEVPKMANVLTFHGGPEEAMIHTERMKRGLKHPLIREERNENLRLGRLIRATRIARKKTANE